MTSVGTVGIIGGGKMGEALFLGIARAGTDALLCEADEARADLLRQRYGAQLVVGLSSIRDCDVILLATKPTAVKDVALALQPPPGRLVISIAAGINTPSLRKWLGPGCDIVRVMPNTPALVGEGMSVLSPAAGCSDEALGIATELMTCVGQVSVVDEDLQDAVTAVSGSGPAYVFLVAEAMTAAGVELGLPPEVAEKLAIQTVVGAGVMLRDAGADAASLRENVTSPGGTTAAALTVLEASGLRESFRLALAAARDRSIELGRDS